MDSELLFRFFEGLTTDSEDQTIKENYQLYNIGNSKPVQLMDFIKEVEPHMAKGRMPLWEDFKEEEFAQLQHLLSKLLTRLGG